MALCELTVEEVAGCEPKLIPCSRILLEKLMVTQFVKTFLFFYGIYRFMTMFRRNV
jgi:hypothetical protein